MKRILIMLSFAAFLLSTTNSFAQMVEIRNFHGTVDQVQKAIYLAWWAVGDDTFVSQIVEHSTDGLNFQPLAEIPVTGGSVGAIYQYLHSTPIVGVNYYRLALLFRDGSRQSSERIKVDLSAPPIGSYPTYPSKPKPGARPRG